MLSQTEHEWWREYAFKCDNRKIKDQNHLKPDFILRKKGWALDTYMAVEFKQNTNPTACVRNMVSDLDKISKIRKSEVKLRSIWAVGVTKGINSTKLDNLVEQYLDDDVYQTKSRSKHIQLKQIGETPFYYVII
ncbi:hypothetical protein PSI23_12775 [Xenorhabdus sp. XENO-10]|uniref:Uncharacterized protein n=1 Tax=Xenorhabdus yunnanensis TaxID=3025878 RepID=A0ABT5LHW4_9GAMM|nr:hypothetical protein [Xenorhabdus yunnanensis]MDC9590148.1 hypothetical protein [Xenorhabdus yunnanensis]